MPRLRKRAKASNVGFSDRLIADLRELIRNGSPWNIDNKYHCDELRGLVTGHFYFTELFDEDDEGAQQALYELLESEFIPAHARYRPGLRPWAWWKWTAPEPRKPVERYFDEDGTDHSEDRPPAVEQAWADGETYFGCPRFSDGWLYEQEYDYLARLDLLLPEEIAIFEKFGCVNNVHISAGDFGKCAPCWQHAREIAKQIDFDLDEAIKWWEFWLPDDLLFPCQHRKFDERSIFTETN